jgi:hypothetical protein
VPPYETIFLLILMPSSPTNIFQFLKNFKVKFTKNFICWQFFQNDKKIKTKTKFLTKKRGRVKRVVYRKIRISEMDISEIDVFPIHLMMSFPICPFPIYP